MAVRIQLASNFQVVELTYDSWEEMDIREVNEATELVNGLGQSVKNDIKTNKPTKEKEEKEKTEEKATPGQIKFLKDKYDIDATKMSKKEAWTTLQKLTKAIED